jgi:hypothetical protein
LVAGASVDVGAANSRKRKRHPQCVRACRRGRGDANVVSVIFDFKALRDIRRHCFAGSRVHERAVLKTKHLALEAEGSESAALRSV